MLCYSYIPIFHSLFHNPRWLFIQQILIQHVYMEPLLCSRQCYKLSKIDQWMKEAKEPYSHWPYILVRRGKQTNYIAKKEIQDGQGKPHWEGDISKDMEDERVIQADNLRKNHCWQREQLMQRHWDESKP